MDNTVFCEGRLRIRHSGLCAQIDNPTYGVVGGIRFLMHVGKYLKSRRLHNPKDLNIHTQCLESLRIPPARLRDEDCNTDFNGLKDLTSDTRS